MSQLRLELPRFSQIGQQDQLTRLILHGTDLNADPATILQGHLMAIIVTGCETAADYVNPALALQRLAQQGNGGRVALADSAMLVQHHHTRRQGIEQGRQAICQLLFLLQLLLALPRFIRQLTRQLVHPRLECAIGIGNLARHAIEQFQRRIYSLIVLLWKQCCHLVVDISRSVGIRLVAGLHNDMCVAHNLSP